MWLQVPDRSRHEREADVEQILLLLPTAYMEGQNKIREEKTLEGRRGRQGRAVERRGAGRRQDKITSILSNIHRCSARSGSPGNC